MDRSSFPVDAWSCLAKNDYYFGSSAGAKHDKTQVHPPCELVFNRLKPSPHGLHAAFTRLHTDLPGFSRLHAGELEFTRGRRLGPIEPGFCRV